MTNEAKQEAQLILVRHGETAANVESRLDYDGPGEPLTERGRRQAEAAATALSGEGISSIWASPLRRALETAEIIAAATGAPVRPHPGLRELQTGSTLHMTPEEVMRRWREYVERSRHDPDYALPGGESPRQLTARVAQAMREIAEASRGRKAVLISHQGTLCIAIGVLLDQLARWQEFQMANCALTRIAWNGSGRLLSLNETEHLAGIGTFVWTGEEKKKQDKQDARDRQDILMFISDLSCSFFPSCSSCLSYRAGSTLLTPPSWLTFSFQVLPT